MPHFENLPLGGGGGTPAPTGGTSFTVSSTAPTTPTPAPGDRWFSNASLKLYTYLDVVSTWVQGS